MASDPGSPIDQCCPRFQALSDPTRVRILELLRGGERCVCELMAGLNIRQSLLSFHLKTLKNTGLVKDRRDGRWIHYSIDWSGLEELEGLISLLKSAAAPSATNCCEPLVQLSNKPLGSSVR
jgi:ArsR family transcriptional regulator